MSNGYELTDARIDEIITRSLSRYRGIVQPATPASAPTKTASYFKPPGVVQLVQLSTLPDCIKNTAAMKTVKRKPMTMRAQIRAKTRLFSRILQRTQKNQISIQNSFRPPPPRPLYPTNCFGASISHTTACSLTTRWVTRLLQKTRLNMRRLIVYEQICRTLNRNSSGTECRFPTLRRSS